MADQDTLPPRLSPFEKLLNDPSFAIAPASGSVAAVTLSARLGLSSVQLDARVGQADSLKQAIQRALAVELPASGGAVSQGRMRVLWHGRDRWMFLAPDADNLFETLSRITPDAGGVVVDQSAGRAILRIEGARSRDVLAKGTGVDLHPRAFAEDHVALTSLFHVSATMDRRAGSTFDLHVARGFAVSFLESVREAAGEFGFDVA